MLPFLVRGFRPAVLGGFLIGSSLIGYARDSSTPGVVRISDSRPQAVSAQPASFGQHLPGQYQGIPAMVDGSPAPYGDCPDGYGYGHYGKHHLFQEHYGKLPPGYGYSLPAKYPIWRRGVQYTQYYPTSWHGTPAGSIAPGVVYPSIYMPTDTTQLGYYYQHVPFWMPNPNALPPRPIPARWHTFAQPSYPSWYVGPGMNGAGPVWSNTNGPAPTPIQTAPAQQADPNAAPIPGSAPPATDDSPKDDSAQGLHIRRANNLQ